MRISFVGLKTFNRTGVYIRKGSGCKALTVYRFSIDCLSHGSCSVERGSLSCYAV